MGTSVLYQVFFLRVSRIQNTVPSLQMTHSEIGFCTTFTYFGIRYHVLLKQSIYDTSFLALCPSISNTTASASSMKSHKHFTIFLNNFSAQQCQTFLKYIPLMFCTFLGLKADWLAIAEMLIKCDQHDYYVIRRLIVNAWRRTPFFITSPRLPLFLFNGLMLKLTLINIMHYHHFI